MVKARSTTTRTETSRKAKTAPFATPIMHGVHPGLISEILGDFRLTDGRTMAEHGREGVVKNLSDFYRKSRQIEDIVHQFVAVYARALRRRETMTRLDLADEKVRARAFRAMAEDSRQFHEVIEAMQAWCKKDRPARQTRVVPDDGSTLVARALRQHKLRRKSAS